MVDEKPIARPEEVFRMGPAGYKATVGDVFARVTSRAQYESEDAQAFHGGFGGCEQIAMHLRGRRTAVIRLIRCV
jgi:hypothetical protein